MSTPATTTLFIHDRGEIACPTHIGVYAAAELKRRPVARILQTPLGSWERLGQADIDQLKTMGVTAACETCAARTRAQGGPTR